MYVTQDPAYRRHVPLDAHTDSYLPEKNSNITRNCVTTIRISKPLRERYANPLNTFSGYFWLVFSHTIHAYTHSGFFFGVRTPELTKLTYMLCSTVHRRYISVYERSVRVKAYLPLSSLSFAISLLTHVPTHPTSTHPRTHS